MKLFSPYVDNHDDISPNPDFPLSRSTSFELSPCSQTSLRTSFQKSGLVFTLFLEDIDAFIFFLFLTFSIPLYKTFWCMWWRIIIRRRRNFWNWCSAALKMFHRLTFLTNPEVQACWRKKFETKENQVLILQTTQDHKKMGEKKEKINVFDVDAVQFVMFWRMQWCASICDFILLQWRVRAWGVQEGGLCGQGGG